MKHWLLLVAAPALVPCSAVDAGEPRGADACAIVVKKLRTEYRVNPLGIDVARPRLGWILDSAERGQRQTAYRILVASSEQALQREKADLWDTGRVLSDRSIQIVYDGEPLRSGLRSYWKVRVWDRQGRASDWSRAGWWEMALLAAEEWTGEWICDGKPLPSSDEGFYEEDPAPLFRKEFRAEKPIRRGRLYITGLGYYEAFLNGRRVGDHLLDPGWTNYAKRILYSTYDVTDSLREGRNAIGVALGNGWYNPLPLRMWGHLNLRRALPTGRPAFIAQLAIDYADGTQATVVSDTTWKVCDGPIRKNSIYLGEVYDARREVPGWSRVGLDDGGWAHAAKAPPPGGRLQARFQPPIRATATLRPVAVTEPDPGIFIVDMGQNFAGWVRLAVEAPRGTEVVLRYGELLDGAGRLNPLTSVCGQIKGRRKDGTPVGGPGAPVIACQTDTYIAAGRGREFYVPRFTWHAFRYVEIRGLPRRPRRDDVVGLRLNSDVESAGSFTCSSGLLERIQRMVRWTFLSNLFSVQSDCPHRERFGYGGDLVATSDAFLLNFDMATLYSKSVRDWHDAALPDGMLTDTAPFVGIQYCGVGWAMAHPHLLWQLWQYYGDRRILEEEYETAARWFRLMKSRNEDPIMKKGLSDHEGLAPAPAGPMVTPLYYQSACLMARIARAVGRADDAREYEALAREIARAYTETFLRRDTGICGPGTQASQSFALYAGLVPESERRAALDVLLEDIVRKHEAHLTTGIFGTKYMLDVLSRSGHAEVALAIASQETFPGWGYMLRNGATTLWEHWEGSDDTFSHNHPMFGSISEWFYEHVAGIALDPEACGFDRFIVAPKPTGKLREARGTYRSIRGLIVSHWRVEDGTLHLKVRVPVGATASIRVPAASPDSVTEGGRAAGSAPGLTFVAYRDGAAVYEAGSGSYDFASIVSVPAPPAAPVAIGDRRELFVDDHVIGAMTGDVRLHLAKPVPREVVLVTDAPWEGNTCAYYTIFRDGDRCRMYYRGSHYDTKARRPAHREVTCYAESRDGIHWEKPSLGLYEFDGSKENNIVWDGIGTHCFTPFRDPNPDCAPDARYKALARGRPRGGKGLYAFASPDGIHWRLLRNEPVITKGAFDSQNLAFWDPHAKLYREYHRAFRGVRDIMTGTSRDFLTWSDPVFLAYPGAPKEHLYTNAIRPYDRAPHILIGFPTRYLPDEGSRVEPTFMASRDGRTFKRWTEALIPKDAPEDRGGNRSNYMAWGLVRLPGRPGEYSVYATEAYYTGPDSRLRRFTYRVDGFVSARAGARGGQLVTRPLVAAGERLLVNFAAREGGYVRVGLEDARGRPIEDFALADCEALHGDAIERAVTWKAAGPLGPRTAEPIRLRFELKDADLYSFRFAP